MFRIYLKKYGGIIFQIVFVKVIFHNIAMTGISPRTICNIKICYVDIAVFFTSAHWT